MGALVHRVHPQEGETGAYSGGLDGTFRRSYNTTVFRDELATRLGKGV